MPASGKQIATAGHSEEAHQDNGALKDAPSVWPRQPDEEQDAAHGEQVEGKKQLVENRRAKPQSQKTDSLPAEQEEDATSTCLAHSCWDALEDAVSQDIVEQQGCG